MSETKTLVDVVNAMSKEELAQLVLDNAKAEAKKKAARQAYMRRNKEKRSAYTKQRNAKRKALFERAKALGLDKQIEAEIAASAVYAGGDEGDGDEGTGTDE